MMKEVKLPAGYDDISSIKPASAKL